MNFLINLFPDSRTEMNHGQRRAEITWFRGLFHLCAVENRAMVNLVPSFSAVYGGDSLNLLGYRGSPRLCNVVSRHPRFLRLQFSRA